ncbi:MAG: alcohol dehydrogenase, partial [Leuconostoc falkenbergense]
MEALVLTGTKKLEVEKIEKPEVKTNEVLIHTAFAGICGTDHSL